MTARKLKLEVISREAQGQACPTPILFVHGAWHSAWCWDEYFLPYFAERGFNVHALSLRNHGKSESVGMLRWRRGSEYVADVAQIASQFATPPVLVAHSMGGYVVQKYLEKYTVPAVVLLTPVPVRGALGGTLRTLRRHPLALLKANLQMRLGPIVETQKLAHDALFSPDMPAEQVARYFPRLQDESYLAFLDLVFLNLPRPKRAHKPPLLALGGDRDALFTPAELKATARAYGGKAHVYPDMAHDMMLERDWQSVADKMISWLKEVPSIW